tara:strand:+ start:5561 stop:5803 length:243 start_codon:yes stop_codon:yes gene_type:complete
MAAGSGGSEWAMASILQGENQVTNIDFHADGNYLVSASKEGELLSILLIISISLFLCVVFAHSLPHFVHSILRYIHSLLQ